MSDRTDPTPSVLPLPAEDFGNVKLAGWREVLTPEPVPFTPQTPGWVGVGLVVGVLLAFLARRVARHRRASQYRRDALAALGEIENRLRIDAERPGALRDLAALLKRTALAAYPREDVASQSGGVWIAWLDQHGGHFSAPPGPLLGDLPYARPERAAALPETQALELAARCRAWIRDHRVRA